MRKTTLTILFCLLMAGSMSAQAQLVIKNLPLATTIAPFDTGLTVVNIGTAFGLATDKVVISRIEFIDKSDRTKDIGFGFNIVLNPGDRWSQMLSQVIGVGRDGQINIHLIMPVTARVAVLGAAIVGDPPVPYFIPVADITSQVIR